WRAESWVVRSWGTQVVQSSVVSRKHPDITTSRSTTLRLHEARLTTSRLHDRPSSPLCRGAAEAVVDRFAEARFGNRRDGDRRGPGGVEAAQGREEVGGGLGEGAGGAQ